MKEGAPQSLPTRTSAGMSRRSFLQYGTAASVLATLTSCSPNTSTVIPPLSRTIPRNKDPHSFDNLDTASTIIGVPFTLNIARENSTSEEVQAKFVDSMTIELDGDTHSIENLTVNGHVVQPNDSLGSTRYTAGNLVDDVRPNTENTGIEFHSSLGSAHISKAELAKLFASLKYPKEGAEVRQEAWVECEIELSDAGRGALGIGNTVNTVINVFCSLTGQDTSAPKSIDIPSGCTLRFTSIRVAPKAESAQELPVEMKEKWNALLRQWFPEWFQRSS